MLGTLETRLAAILSDRLAAHTHLTVGIAPLAPPAAGKGIVALSVTGITPRTGFSPFDTSIVGTAAAPRSRRVLPVEFTATLDLRAKPAAAGEPARIAARARLLEDISAAAFALADPELQTGAAFATAGSDQGFQVLRFGLVTGTAAPGSAGDDLSGQIVLRGEAQLWPVGEERDEGVIERIDRLIAPLPLIMRVAPAGVRPDSEARIEFDLGGLRRRGSASGTPEPAELALSVLADVPVGQRGTVPDSLAGAEPGIRIVPAAPARVEILYRAPSADPGPAGRIEYLAVHLATPERARGLYLGSAAIRLLAAP
jgi:hypothetical protein